MATNKNTTLQTRIKLKYDTLTNWIANDPVLLKGELAIVDPGITAADGSATVLIKVGDGTSKFSACPYLWSNASDVYSWAKASTKPSYSYNEISGTPTIPTVGNGTVTITQNGTSKGSFTLNASGNTTIALTDTNTDTNTTYKLVQDTTDKHKIKLQASTNGGTSWTDVSDYITIPDNNTTYTLATGSANGTVSFNGTDVAVKGLGSLAYKSSLSKSDVGLGSVVNAGQDSTPTASSTNYVTSGGVKTYVDNAISGLTKFDIVKVDSFANLPTTGVKGTIYLVPDTHSDSNDSYDEYLWNTTITTPAYEKIGNTDVNLTNYVNTVNTSGSGSFVTGVTKSGNTVTITKGSLPTATASSLGVVKGGTTSGKTYGVSVASDGSMTVSVPWTDTNTDTKVTSAANHYTPAADTTAALSASASSTTAASWNTTSLVTGVNLQRDAKGHVTGVTVNSIKMPANPNTDTNTAHSHTAGVGLIISGSGGISGTTDYKVALVSDTLNSSAALTRVTNADRLYPVEVDKNGKLAVTVPWTTSNARIIDAGGQEIFNSQTDTTLLYIDCGSSSELV
jgi:hypothetical protein